MFIKEDIRVLAKLKRKFIEELNSIVDVLSNAGINMPIRISNVGLPEAIDDFFIIKGKNKLLATSGNNRIVDKVAFFEMKNKGLLLLKELRELSLSIETVEQVNIYLYNMKTLIKLFIEALVNRHGYKDGHNLMGEIENCICMKI